MQIISAKTASISVQVMRLPTNSISYIYILHIYKNSDTTQKHAFMRVLFVDSNNFLKIFCLIFYKNNIDFWATVLMLYIKLNFCFILPLFIVTFKKMCNLCHWNAIWKYSHNFLVRNKKNYKFKKYNTMKFSILIKIMFFELYYLLFRFISDV